MFLHSQPATAGSRYRPLSTRRGRRRSFISFENLESRQLLAAFMVTNTDAFGPGSLWQAMFDADNTPNVGGPDEVHFNIPGSGVHTIFPDPELPTIHFPVIIDGYTQPGASPNTLAVGDDAVLKIEINGSNLPGSSSLFIISGSNSTVRGLAITHVPDYCFYLGIGHIANDNTIAGNFIGTDAAGMTYQGGTGGAIRIWTGTADYHTANDNVIGGTAPADRNVIASVGADASIKVESGDNNVIQGNYIGVNKDGTAPLQPPFGTVAVSVGVFAGGAIIGGTTPGAGNVILGTGAGIVLFGTPTNGNPVLGSNVVQGNFIGTNATGTAGLGSGAGIQDQSASDTIAGNLISGGTTAMVIGLPGFAFPGPTIQGNKIGTDVTGTLAIPNSGDGILVYSGSASSATIGGTNPGEGNTIAHNGGLGVYVHAGTGCSILGNSIFDNGSRGIRLFWIGDDVQTQNDPGDGDPGANDLQNYPIITSAQAGAYNTIVAGTFNSTSSTTFHLEFFASAVADASGFGEGQKFLGSTDVTTDAAGDVNFEVNLARGGGAVISATATNPAGSTSEFSHDFTATNPDVIIDAMTPQSVLDGLTVIRGSLILVGVAGRSDLLLPNLTEVDGAFIVTGNPDLTTLSVPTLASVSGDIDVSDNPALTAVNLGSVTTVGGSVNISNDTGATVIDASSLTTVGGSVDISNDAGATVIDASSLTTVGGSVDISNDAGATVIDASSLTTVGGSVDISDDTGATVIDASSLTTVGGSVDISDDTGATVIDASSLTTVGGSVDISNDRGATVIDLSTLSTVGGDLTVEAMNTIIAVTADGSTEITLFSAQAQMTAALATGTFADPVPFTVTRLDPATLPPEDGLNSSGAPATIDPLAAYHFNFAIPALGQNASLTFEINLAALSAADRDAFLAALAAGNATVAVKNDALGSAYQAFAVCAPGQTPADGCVAISRPDADHVVFQGVTGHFSTFAVVLVNTLGTAGDDNLTLRASNDGTMLEVYNGNPPGTTPIFTWPMNASSPLVIRTLAGNDIITVELPAGSNGPSGGIQIDTGSGSNQLLITGGKARIDAISTAGSLGIVVSNGAELRTSGFDHVSLSLAGGGTKVTVLPGGATASVLTTLQLGDGTILDVTDNALVLDYAGASPVARIRDKIISGRGGIGLGKPWNGVGINSSTAAGVNANAPNSRSVGYAENALLPLGAYTIFRGQAVDATSVLIAYTRTGDANLNGVVNDDDVTVVGTFYAPGDSKPEWAKGDFDYNGFVDDDDVTLLGVFYQPAAMPTPAPGPTIEPFARSTDVGALSIEPDALSAPHSPAAQQPIARSAKTPETNGQPHESDPATSVERVKSRSGAIRLELRGHGLQDRKNDRPLIDLLAESIAADRAASRISISARRLSMARKAMAADSYWTGNEEEHNH